MTSPLHCPHDDAIVKEKRNPKSGVYYQCSTCKCTFRAFLAIITNDTKCYNKRMGITDKPKQEKETKKKRTPSSKAPSQ
jgi:hypothetical protein